MDKSQALIFHRGGYSSGGESPGVCVSAEISFFFRTSGTVLGQCRRSHQAGWVLSTVRSAPIALRGYTFRCAAL